MQKHTAVALAQSGVIVAILLWFGSIMIDCEHFLAKSCDQAIYVSWLDLWRLRWISNYKEIVAALIASVAAWAAIYAVRLQISANRENDIAKSAQQVSSALSLVSADFDRALMTYSRSVTDKNGDMRMAWAALPAISQADPTFSRIMATAIHAVELGFGQAIAGERIAKAARAHAAKWGFDAEFHPDEEFDDETISDGWMHAAAMRSFLSEGGAVVRPDSSIKLARVSPRRYVELAVRLGHDLEGLPMRDLFDWNEPPPADHRSASSSSTLSATDQPF